MTLVISVTNSFKRDLKRVKARHFGLNLLKTVVDLLVEGSPLPKKYRDHALSNNWKGYRECHLAPDWLLVYRVSNEELVLVLSRTGTHSDLDF